MIQMSGYRALVSIRSNLTSRVARYDVGPQYFSILNTLHLAVMVHCVYYYLVTNYTDVSALTVIVWSFKVSARFGPLEASTMIDGSM